MCDILAAISYSYGYNERPRKRVKINMTIPSRPAPPPPQRNTTAPLRYTPTTDWDFCAFDASSTSSSQAVVAGNGPCFAPAQQNVKSKKPPPPRPPPPKLSGAPTAAPLKKPNQPQSINILSSLFGHKRGSNGSATASKSASCTGASHQKQSVSLKLPLPPTGSGSLSKHAANHTVFAESGVQYNSTNYASFAQQSTRSAGTGAAEMQLISFDSPPSSPTFTQKSCSDCISVDSFSSDSNYSSPNNGNMSQAESGFEDDFVACGSNNHNRHNRNGSNVPWGDLDPFDGGAVTSTTPGPILYGTVPLASSATAQIRTPLINSKLQHSDFVDPLCNGQSVLPKLPTVSMPTIIKPPSNPDSQKSTPSHSISMRNKALAPTTKPMPPKEPSSLYAGLEDSFSLDTTEAFDSLTSHPMPSVPPPPPPSTDLETYGEEPYGIAMYDFQGEADEDLSFKTNEKIYLLKRLNDEWYMGRDKRGLEGMFPVNYVEVKVPLLAGCLYDERSQQHSVALPLTTSTASFGDGVLKVRALYNFKAEAPEDLSMVENDLVAVLYQITPEWLYGEIDGRRGQFPANYIEYVPQNLPQMPTACSSSSSSSS
ncbi:LOW QUALITY PROTEIN: cell wall protein RBR3 [Anopheles stephensi]|uniref:LOW QUALITY PROTEIN: cell wall protein RBR3 n=1 Tax=Anopheles stephensi TaxID=30069 RepID=UPI001658AAB6|nr:LOW QUALITY PROTEIN: cell wall protein RBR3 [Anopheles stephensi]